jgi:P-type Cu2+ transporter
LDKPGAFDPSAAIQPDAANVVRLQMPEFPGSQWIAPGLSIIIFFYGGLPFLQMAVPELRNRQPGMMTLISLAIIVAFVYSLAAEFILAEETFFGSL